jgi:coenzyme F420-reducing hydrogenase delta subunit
MTEQPPCPVASSPRIVLIGCAHSAGAAIEDLATQGRALPANVEWVSVPCGSGIDELHILRAFEANVDQVMVLACYSGACRSLEGSIWAEKRTAAVRTLLEEAGIAGWRLAFHNIAPNMAADLVQWLADFHEPAPVAEAKPETST